MERFKQTDWIMGVIVPLLIGLISFFLLTSIFTSARFTSSYEKYLDEKKTTVIEISAASTAASAAVTMLPDDMGTPIANKLADISEYSLLILCAVFLEKYLVTLSGYASFRILIPFACLLYIVGFTFMRKHKAKQLAIKLALFSIVFATIIPASIKVSKSIENTYQESIQETIDTAKGDASEIQENIQSDTEDNSLWNKFISTIEGGVSGITVKFEKTLTNFIEAIAVLIVTSCLIPILVLVFMVWMIKMVFNISPQYPYPPLIPMANKQE